MMNIQEALNNISGDKESLELVERICKRYWNIYLKELEIPKAPIRKMGGTICPNCSTIIGKIGDRCVYCNQKLLRRNRKRDKGSI